MQANPVRIFLILFLIVLIYPSSLIAATERRTALVIGNSAYSSGPLKNPVNDATDMAKSLQKLGFTVNLKKNADLQTMEEAIEDFGNHLKRGGVGLFYYAGHGVQVGGDNYLIPVGARINKESDVRFKAFDAGRILAEMENANNGVNIVLLDACRDNPFGKSFRSASRGLAIVSNSPSGTFISYSTSPGQVARDGEGKNSPYTKALLENMAKPGLTINEVFMNVRSKLKRETGQVPWELSSLEGNFYFMPGAVGAAPEPALTAKQPEKQKPVASEPADELELAMAKLRQQKEDKAAQKKDREGKFRALLEDVKKYKTIAGEDLDAETKNMAWKALIRKYPQWSAGVETGQTDEILLKVVEGDADGSFKNILVQESYSRNILGQESYSRIIAAKELAEAKKQYQSSYPGKEIIKVDGRFVAFSDGTVLDTRTNLMWAAKDNGSKINWQDAKSYCENYRGGGYSDWRMPTQDELVGLYDAGKGYGTGPYNVHTFITKLIKLTSWIVWGSDLREASGAFTTHYAPEFSFNRNARSWGNPTDSGLTRALPVRSVK